MDKKILVFAFLLVLAVSLIVPLIIGAKPGNNAVRACRDGVDNDGDGYIDWPDDPGCARKQDDSELNPDIECDDGVDNDGDNNIDYADAGCSSPTDDDETDCGDGVCEGGETSVTCPADCGYPDSCTDTDGGNVITVFGTAYGYLDNMPYSDDDYCVGSQNITEYYCVGDYGQSQMQSCGDDYYGSDYCMNDSVYRDYNDYFCSSGACDFTATPELVEECEYGCIGGECNSIPDSCSDTDGGFVVVTQGTVSGYFNEQYYNNTDFCITSQYLMEHYCGGNYALNVSTSCVTNTTTSCSNGVCI